MLTLQPFQYLPQWGREYSAEMRFAMEQKLAHHVLLTAEHVLLRNAQSPGYAAHGLLTLVTGEARQEHAHANAQILAIAMETAAQAEPALLPAVMNVLLQEKENALQQTATGNAEIMMLIHVWNGNHQAVRQDNCATSQQINAMRLNAWRTGTVMIGEHASLLEET